MALFLITGLPGTGKTTLCETLKQRGYTAFDGDKDRLAKWFDIATNTLAHENYDKKADYLRTHARRIPKETLIKLSEKYKDDLVFICNDPENEDELRDLFEHIFALVLDEANREQRVISRTNNNWGKLPHEVERDKARRTIAEQRYTLPNYTKIDATLPTEQIADTVLDMIAQK